MPEPATPTAAAVTAQVVLSRLSVEIDRLSQQGEDLQEALHALPLAAADPPTRRALQSVDRMTQTLNCLGEVVAALARADATRVPCDLPQLLAQVRLEDFRLRLLTGAEPSPAPAAAGAVDLF